MKKKEKEKEKQLPEKKAPQLPAGEIDFSKDLGGEEVPREALTIPFLNVLQTNSPQCDKGGPDYVKGAVAGDFHNNVTNEFYSGEKGVLIVPCTFVMAYARWVPRDQGGGFRGQYTPAEFSKILPNLKEITFGKWEDEEGNHVVQTHYHYVLHVIEPTNPLPVVLRMASTQIRASSNWITQMQLKPVELNGQLVRPAPWFLFMYRFMTKTQRNEKGTWKGLDIKEDHKLRGTEQQIYDLARTLKLQVKKGIAVHAEPTQTPTDDDAPF